MNTTTGTRTILLAGTALLAFTACGKAEESDCVAGSPSAEPAAATDDCWVGSWTATGVSIPANGVSVSGGAGTTFVLDADGQAVWDMDQSGTFTGESDQAVVEVRLRGRVSGTVEVAAETMAFDLKGPSRGTTRIVSPIETPWSPIPFEAVPGEATYTCSGDLLAVTTVWRGAGEGTWDFVRTN